MRGFEVVPDHIRSTYGSVHMRLTLFVRWTFLCFKNREGKLVRNGFGRQARLTCLKHLVHRHIWW